MKKFNFSLFLLVSLFFSSCDFNFEAFFNSDYEYGKIIVKNDSSNFYDEITEIYTKKEGYSYIRRSSTNTKKPFFRTINVTPDNYAVKVKVFNSKTCETNEFFTGQTELYKSTPTYKPVQKDEKVTVIFDGEKLYFDE